MSKKIDILLLIIFPILAVILSLYLRANFLTSIILYFVVPSLWFSFKTPKKVIKTFFFSLITSIPMVMIIDYVGGSDMSWYVPTIFNFRVLDIIPVEDFLMGFSATYYTIIFYEHFFDKGKRNFLDKHIKYLIWPLIVVIVLMISTYLMSVNIPTIQYAYLWLGTVLGLIPSAIFLYFFPQVIYKYAKTTLYFFLIYFLFEITGLELQQWSFPGVNFIGWIELSGYRFPIEEFFIWMIGTTIAILSYFEFFDDDRK